MNRTGFKRKVYTPPPVAPLRPLTRQVNYDRVPALFKPLPKSEPYRDRALLDMAKGRHCLLQSFDGGHNIETTVAAHSNESRHGKGKSRKADDIYSVWACARCHTFFDFAGIPRDEARELFAVAHAKQIRAWKRIAVDPSEPARFRKAAQRALEELEKRKAT